MFPGSDWPDEVAPTREIYCFPAGHNLTYDEESEILEFNPAAAAPDADHHIENMLAEGRFRA